MIVNNKLLSYSQNVLCVYLLIVEGQLRPSLGPEFKSILFPSVFGPTQTSPLNSPPIKLKSINSINSLEMLPKITLDSVVFLHAYNAI